MKIILDAMGGDNAPQAVVQGALEAHAQCGADIVLVGREEAIRACLTGPLPEGVEIVNATEVVDMCDDPATAFKRKKDSSLTVGLTMLKNGEGDAFISAGSTGALLAGATLLVKRIRGVRRAAMGPVLPTATGRALLCDCGANADCTPEYLLQFAYLGNFYAQRLMGVEKPRVGLLNIGAEPSKGDTLRHETYALLEEAGREGRLNFIGNIEAKEAIKGGCDVIVCDGFSGNVLLKTMEGVGSFAGSALKAMFKKNLLTKLHCEGTKTVFIEAAGPCEVTAGDIKPDGEVEVLNPELHIATLDVGATLSMEITLSHGRGYVSADRNKALRAGVIGVIPIDSIYTPVYKVNYTVENTRVGNLSDFDKLTLEVWTDGTISARDAVSLGAKILCDHFTLFTDLSENVHGGGEGSGR